MVSNNGHLSILIVIINSSERQTDIKLVGESFLRHWIVPVTSLQNPYKDNKDKKIIIVTKEKLGGGHFSPGAELSITYMGQIEMASRPVGWREDMASLPWWSYQNYGEDTPGRCHLRDILENDWSVIFRMLKLWKSQNCAKENWLFVTSVRWYWTNSIYCKGHFWKKWQKLESLDWMVVNISIANGFMTFFKVIVTIKENVCIYNGYRLKCSAVRGHHLAKLVSRGLKKKKAFCAILWIAKTDGCIKVKRHNIFENYNSI